MSEMTPREIVSELDKHIIGQDADNFAWGHFRHGRSLRFRR